MTSPELLVSWKCTTAYLAQARAQFSVDSESTHAHWFAEIDEFIDHNELGLAYDYLESLARESDWHCLPLLEALALAAHSMGKEESLRALEGRIAELRT